MELDDFQEQIGGISNYQVAIIFAICLVTFGQDFASEAPVFLNAVPSFQCKPIEINAFSTCNFTKEEVLNLTSPFDRKKHLSCSKYTYKGTECVNNCNYSCFQNQSELSTCNNGYTYDDNIYGSTTTSQFNLVCDRRYLDTIAQTLFFFGFFLGSAVVGPLADWFGRKTAMLILVTGYIVSSFGSAFSPTYAVYAIFRILIGMFYISGYIAAFTYVCEISNTKWRTKVATLSYLSTALAHTVLPGLAYWIRNWRYLQITIGFLPSSIYIFYYFLPETPRWLFANDKNEEARKVLSRYAESKNTILTDDTWNAIVKSEQKKRFGNSTIEQSLEEKLRVWDLFRRPLMRIMCFNVIFSWFTTSMVFYGLVLNGGYLAGDPYVNTALNAMVEIFAYICVYFADLVGRKPMLIVGFVMAGFSCLSSMLCVFFADGNSNLLMAGTVLAIVGKFFTTNVFGLIYSVTSEVFPTNVRATGVSLGSMAARVGGMCSPLLLEIQRSLPWFTQTVFGVLSIIAGGCSIIYPETSRTNFLTSMDEAEEYYRENITICNFLAKKTTNDCVYNSKVISKKDGNTYSYVKVEVRSKEDLQAKKYTDRNSSEKCATDV